MCTRSRLFRASNHFLWSTNYLSYWPWHLISSYIICIYMIAIQPNVWKKYLPVISSYYNAHSFLSTIWTAHLTPSTLFSSQSTDNDSKPQTKLTMADPKQSAPVTEIKKPELTKAKPVSPPKPLFAQTTKSASPFKGFGSFTSTSKPTTSGFTGFQFGSSMVIAPAPSQSSSQPDSQVTFW